MLETAPRDSALWASYMGKPWIIMSITEKEQIGTWMENLLNNRGDVMEEKEELVASNSNDDNIWHFKEVEQEIKAHEEEELHKEQIAYIKDLEEISIIEPTEIVELKANIRQNFVILDDLYAEQFEALGLPYKTYAETFPRGNYSKETWLKEKEEQLKQVKMRKLTALRRQMAAGQQ
jgi:hypothetical protein